MSVREMGPERSELGSWPRRPSATPHRSEQADSGLSVCLYQSIKTEKLLFTFAVVAENLHIQPRYVF